MFGQAHHAQTTLDLAGVTANLVKDHNLLFAHSRPRQRAFPHQDRHRLFTFGGSTCRLRRPRANGDRSERCIHRGAPVLGAAERGIDRGRGAELRVVRVHGEVSLHTLQRIPAVVKQC